MSHVTSYTSPQTASSKQDGGEREKLLELNKVTTHYGPIRVLHDVDMVIYPGEMVCLLGGNASGKSTTLKTILGLVRVSEGEMYFRGERADTLDTAGRIQRGMAVVPENRRIFPKMTVKENLEMGSYLRDDRKAIREDMDYVFDLFPRLSERVGQMGGTMSGGGTADAGDGPRPHEPPQAHPHGRALDGPSTLIRRKDFPDYQAGQRARHQRVRGRAERQRGAVDCRPGLCAANRRGGVVGSGEGAFE